MISAISAWSRFAPMVWLVFSFLGCATAEQRHESFAQAMASQELKVHVTNLAFMDATLWGVTTGGRYKLGIVTGKREAVLTMPLRFHTDMYIEIDILAGPRCLTDQLPVDPGDELELVIQNDYANWNCVRR